MVAAATAEVNARVVIVDESADSREVLHTLLETRGVASVEGRGAREGLDLIRQHHPAVVVMDLESGGTDDEQLDDELASVIRDQNAALVVLGSVRRYVDALPEGQVISKPYHYAPLLRTIERLLTR